MNPEERAKWLEEIRITCLLILWQQEMKGDNHGNK